jgi:VCBS repeat-containing protein
MATLIGVVSQIVGEVFAEAADGTRRSLSEGDRLFAGEKLVTGANGSVAVALSNGQSLTVGRDSSLDLTPQLLAGESGNQAPQAEPQNTAPSDQDLTDVERLQAAIEAGDDPTQLGEATAAGPGAGAGGAGGAGGGNSFVMLDATGRSVDPTIGFPTQGLNRGPEFPDPLIGATDEPEPEVPAPPPPRPDSTPDITVDYTDSSGTLQSGPGVVDEEALASGTNPGSAAEQAFGKITITSPDGVSALQIQDVNGNWIDVTSGGTVQGKYGVLSVDAAGNWTYTLSANTLDHSNPNAIDGNDQVGESFPARMFDLDGDVSPTVNIDVRVLDDGPKVELATEAPELMARVDESLESLGGIQGDGIASATLSAATVQAQFSSQYGADGAGSAGGGTYSLELSGANVSSGLFAVAAGGGKGAEIVLNQSGNVITGSIGEQAYFTLTINNATGEVTVQLLDNLWHSNNGDFDDAEVLSLAAGVLKLTQTLTDGDGDQASVSLDLGVSGAIGFEDDGPTARLSEEPGELGAVVVDESPVSDQTDGVASAVLDATVVQAQFDSVFGADGAAQGDESKATTYSLELKGEGEGVASGLFTVDANNVPSGKGDPILLNQSGNVITGSAGGVPYFTLTIDPVSGAVTLDLLGNIWHSGSSDADDREVLSLEGNTLLLTQTVTDGDGDSDSVSIDLGAAGVFAFEDDGPTANPECVQPILDDEGLNGGINGGVGDTPGAATTATGTLDFSAGADGLKSFELSAPDTLGAEAVTSTWVGNVLTITSAEGRGDLLTVQVNPENGEYTVTLLQPLRHEEGLNENNIHVNIGYTVTDNDGDSASSIISINIDDDTPTISHSEIADNSYVTFNGSNAGYANSYGYYIKGPDGTPLTGKVIWSNVLNLSGGDVASLEGLDPAKVGFFIIPNGDANDGLSDGAALTFEFEGDKWHALLDGVRLEGADGANVLFSDATLNPGGAHLQDTAESGNQNWEDQTNTSDYDYNDVSVSVTWSGSLQVDESDFDVDASHHFSGLFNVDPGADGQRSLKYDLTLKGAEDGPVDSGLVDSLSGKPVTLHLVDAWTIEGRVSTGELVFTVSVDAEGKVTLDQDRSVMHPTQDPDEPIGLDANLIGLRATVTDNDGDSASSTLDLGKLISFKDDAPTAKDDTPDALVEGDAANVVSGNVLSNDSAGNDGGKAFVGWNSSPANAAAIAELSKYGTLVLNPDTGGYTFTLNNDDPDTLGLAKDQLVSQKLQYTMKDADGDISTAFLTIEIVGGNNGISLNGLEVKDGEVIVDEKHLATGSAPEAGKLTKPGTFDFDSPDKLETIKIGDKEFTFSQLQGATAAAPLVIESTGGVLHITGLTGDATGGTVHYVYTLENAVGHEAIQGTNTLGEQFDVLVTDRDGDTATGTIDVTIIDDVPVAKDNKVSIDGTGLPPYNLTLVIDTSGSMNDKVNADLDGDGDQEGVSRLDVAKAALVKLIDSYIALGVPLNFKVIDFSDSSKLAYEGTDSAAAKVAINNMSQGGYTHYSTALSLARTELEQDLANPALNGYENRVYFLSDGEPNPSANGAPASWQTFVDSNNIDVIAVGIQVPASGSAATALAKVANVGDKVIVVSDPNELSVTLGDTVPDNITGNVISDAGTDGVDVIGADGPIKVISISYTNAAGVVQTVDVPATGTTAQLVTQLGGTLTIASDGSYTYKAPQNVSGDSEDVFTYTVKDADGDTSKAKLTISIKDGVPEAKDNEAGVEESGMPPYNLTLVLDSSGSMNDKVNADLNGDGVKESVSRLDVAKAALVKLINSYIALGVPLNFKVIDFSDSSKLAYEGTDSAAAKVAINNMSQGGYTHYSTALSLARTELEQDLANPALNGYENRVYFLSDGEPNPSANGAPASWQTFVDSNNIDVIAVGIQVPASGSAATALGKVANAGDTVIVVSDPNELAATLADTVPGTLAGNVITDVGVDGVDAPGTDGPISVVSVSYTNSAGEVVSVNVPVGGTTGPLTTELGGTLVISSNGSYSYSSPRNAPEGAKDQFTYTISDRDGDTSTANLTINILDGGPVAKDDTAQAQEGNWKLGGNITYSSQYVPSRDVDVNDVSNTPNQGLKAVDSNKFTVTASDSAPSTVTLSASTRDWDSADRWQAELFRVGDSNPVAQLLDQSGNRTNVTFDSITQSGQYYVRFTVRDNSGSSGSNLGRADLDITKLQYTNPLQNISVTVPGVVWVAALMASGNVLSNDNQGPDGGLSVTGVNGQDMEVGGLSLDGQYGTLHIAANGSYTYIPLSGDLPSGASDSFTYDIVDADGSTDSAVLTVGIKDAQYSSTSNSSANLVGGNDGNNTLDGQGGNDVVYGGAGNDTLFGGNGNDHLLGGDGNDILYGQAGNDVLNGGAGNDKLYGGAGNDWLIGGEGEDTFIWTPGESGIDVIADFQTGQNGDVLDLSALLEGERADNLESFLTFSFGPSTTIVADSNGASGGGNIQTIVLDGVNLSQVYGSSDAGDVIAGMLEDGNLKVS